MNPLTKVRKDHELKQTEMAEKIGVSISTYTKIESDHLQPSFNFLHKLKTVFPEVDVNEFFK